MKIVDNSLANRDLFAIDVDSDLGEACGVLFKIREGKLIGKFHRFLRNIEGVSRSAMIQSFVVDFYTDSRDVGEYTFPAEVFLSDECEGDKQNSGYLMALRRVQVCVV